MVDSRAWASTQAPQVQTEDQPCGEPTVAEPVDPPTVWTRLSNFLNAILAEIRRFTGSHASAGSRVPIRLCTLQWLAEVMSRPVLWPQRLAAKAPVELATGEEARFDVQGWVPWALDVRFS